MLSLKVTTTNILNPSESEKVRFIDYLKREDRVWLGKHCYWAFNNGYSVKTEPILSNED